MDREAREQYLVVVQVKDMLGLSGGYSASTTVTVSLTDVNDNGPTFQHRESLIHYESQWCKHRAMHTEGESMREYKALQTARRCLILYLRGIYLITLLRFRVGGFFFFVFFFCVFFFVPPAPQSAVHISLFRRQPKLKGDSRGTSEGDRKEKEWRRRGCSVHQRVHTYMCRPLDEFNHSHMRGHLSWPLETNLALPSDKPPAKWMPGEEINSVENETARTILLTIDITFAFNDGATASRGLHVQSKGALLILYGHTSLWTVPCALSHNCKLLSAGIYFFISFPSPRRAAVCCWVPRGCGIHPNGVKRHNHIFSSSY